MWTAFLWCNFNMTRSLGNIVLCCSSYLFPFQLNNQSICFACIHKSIFHAEKSFVEIALPLKTKLYSRSLKLFFLLCKELVYFPLMWKYWRDLARVFAVDIKFFVRAFFFMIFHWCKSLWNEFRSKYSISSKLREWFNRKLKHPRLYVSLRLSFRAWMGVINYLLFICYIL